MGKHLPGDCKVLSSIPSTTNSLNQRKDVLHYKHIRNRLLLVIPNAQNLY